MRLLDRIRPWFDPPQPIAYSIRFATAVTAAIGLGKAPGLVENNSTWILITVLLVMQPTTGGSLVKGVFRAFGTVLGALTAIVIFGIYAQDPPLLMAALFIVQLVSAYGFSGTRFQYAYFVYGLTTTIVLADAMSGTEAIETLAFQRASMVGIGILIVLAADSLFWPVTAEKKLRASLASRAIKIGSALRTTLFAGTPRAEELGIAKVPDTLAVQLGLASAVRSELGVRSDAVDRLGRAMLLLESIDSRSRELSRRIASIDPDSSRLASEILSPLGQIVSAAVEQSAVALAESRDPALFANRLEAGLLEFEYRCSELAKRDELDSDWYGLVGDLRDLVALLCRVENVLVGGRDRPVAGDAAPGLRFRADALRTRVALRTATAVISALLAVMMLGWPMNSLVAPVSFTLAALPRAKARQTLIGLALVIGLGWMLADLMIVFVTPHAGRAPAGLVSAFVCAGGMAYAAARVPALAMLPSVGGLIATLSVFGGPDAATNVYASYDTVCYMALAIGLGWLFSRTMWPATAAGIFRERVAIQLGACLAAIREARGPSARSRSMIAADLLRACGRETVALGPLHEQAKKEPVERDLDEARRAQLMTLPTNLMDATLGDRPDELVDLSSLAEGRFRLLDDAIRDEDAALQASLESVIAALRGMAGGSDSRLAAAEERVEGELAALREVPEVAAALPDRQRHAILVALDARRRLVFRQAELDEWLETWLRDEKSRGPTQ
jgi:uncharacterized membrane protein YccC